jgi:hypothetical protein
MRKVNQRWLEDFETFLLERVTANSANNYLHKIKAALNIAVKQGSSPQTLTSGSAS